MLCSKLVAYAISAFFPIVGLGLNISKSLIELHGGIIGVSSSGVSGAGCEFFFEIPMSIVPSAHRSVSVSPQVFHVSNLKGPATMRAWHSPAVPLRGLAGAAAADSPGSSVSVSVTGLDGTNLAVPKMQQQKSSPSLFSLQAVQHTSAPLTVAVRQRMLERSHQGNASVSLERREFHPQTVSSHMPADMVSFSPLVGSSRRVASTLRSQLSGINVHPWSGGSPDTGALASPLVVKDPPATPGTQQINMISASPPLVNSHLSKLALLQGLANESVGYGYGYASRPPAAQTPQQKNRLGLRTSASHGKDDSTEMTLAPVLTPMDDDEAQEADVTSASTLATIPQEADGRAFTPMPAWNHLPSHIETPQQGGGLTGDLSPPPMPTRAGGPRTYFEPQLEIPVDRADGHSQQVASGSLRRQSFDSSSSNSESSSASSRRRSLNPISLAELLKPSSPAKDAVEQDASANLALSQRDSSSSAADGESAHGSIAALQKASASKDAKQFRSVRLHVGLSHGRANSIARSMGETPIASPSAGPWGPQRSAGDESSVVNTPVSATIVTPGSSDSSSVTSASYPIAGVTPASVTSATPTPAAAPSTSTSTTSTASPPFRPRILVVEDSAPNRSQYAPRQTEDEVDVCSDD
jgi:hypothetical protein